MTTPLSRRALLSCVAGAGVAVAGTAALASCAPGKPGGSATQPLSGPDAAAPPAHVPFAEVTPDLPGTVPGALPGFFNYPDPPVVREGYPLSGIKPFTMLMQGGPPRIAADKNRAYQQMWDTVGTKFDIVHGLFGADYMSKFQTTVAGGNLPDLAMVVPVARLPRLLESSFSDLTDHLSGDAIAKYPGLANIPTESWQVASINGRIWGVPQPRTPAGVVVNARGDLLAQVGIDDPNVKLRDGKDFVDLLAQLTDRGQNRFAMGADPTSWLMWVTKTMTGVPNNWEVRDGRFVSEIETDELEMALVEAGKIVQAGYLHPNSFSDPSQNAVWYQGGVTSLYVHSFGGWGRDMRTHPEWNVGNVELPLWDGSGPARIRKTVPGYGAYVAFKKTDDDRIDQLLRFADHVASPFGTQQYLDVNFGVPEYNYTIEGGNPTTIPDGPGAPPVSYLGGNGGAVIFGQGDVEGTKAQYDYLVQHLPDGLHDASQGLYSETAGTKGATLNSAMFDVQREVMQGTKPVSEWRDFVKTWKSQVGDTIAAEYHEAAEQR